jgi:hypothetical protein
MSMDPKVNFFKYIYIFYELIYRLEQLFLDTMLGKSIFIIV